MTAYFTAMRSAEIQIILKMVANYVTRDAVINKENSARLLAPPRQAWLWRSCIWGVTAGPPQPALLGELLGPSAVAGPRVSAEHRPQEAPAAVWAGVAAAPRERGRCGGGWHTMLMTDFLMHPPEHSRLWLFYGLVFLLWINFFLSAFHRGSYLSTDFLNHLMWQLPSGVISAGFLEFAVKPKKKKKAS